MKKRSIAVLLAAAMVVTSLFSGCGNTTTTSSGTTSGTESTASTSSSSEASTADTGKLAAAGITTEVGTPREETLIVETQTPTDTPGQFNTYSTPI